LLECFKATAEPLFVLWRAALSAAGKPHTPDLLLRYAALQIGLGLARPIRERALWHKGNPIGANPYLAGLMGQVQFRRVMRHMNFPVDQAIADLSVAFKAAWEASGFLSGDETIVPHRGRKSVAIRVYVPRKPHPTGIKLFLVADAEGWYTYDILLYTRKLAMGRPNRNCGNFTPDDVCLPHVFLPCLRS
jgi:hypothetical protein